MEWAVESRPDSQSETDPMSARPDLHPTDQDLRAYGLGKLDDSSAESVNKHLESCSDCRQRVGDLTSDGVFGRIQGARKDPSRPVMSGTDAGVAGTGAT